MAINIPALNLPRRKPLPILEAEQMRLQPLRDLTALIPQVLGQVAKTSRERRLAEAVLKDPNLNEGERSLVKPGFGVSPDVGSDLYKTLLTYKKQGAGKEEDLTFTTSEREALSTIYEDPSQAQNAFATVSHKLARLGYSVRIKESPGKIGKGILGLGFGKKPGYVLELVPLKGAAGGVTKPTTQQITPESSSRARQSLLQDITP